MNTKNNKRFNETQVKINAALLRLMQKYPFEKITVRMICGEAQINRSTFYAHYLDLFDLLDKMTEQLFDMLYYDAEALVQQSVEKEATEAKMMSLLLEHIEEHKFFYSAFLKSRKELPLLKSYKIFWERIVKPAGIRAGIAESESYYYFLCMKASFNAILEHWVERNCSDDKAKITAIMSECFPSIIKTRVDSLNILS